MSPKNAEKLATVRKVFETSFTEKSRHWQNMKAFLGLLRKNPETTTLAFEIERFMWVRTPDMNLSSFIEPFLTRWTKYLEEIGDGESDPGQSGPLEEARGGPPPKLDDSAAEGDVPSLPAGNVPRPGSPLDGDGPG